jgi:capsid protein
MRKRNTRTIDPKQKYDAVTGSTGAAGTGNKRRKATVELFEESGASGILNNHQRLSAVSLGRDIERNYSVAKSLFKQLRNNVVGALGKIQVNTGDAWGAAAMRWFNKDFFVNCDFRSTEDFSKLSRNILAAKKREGDILVVFDDGLFNIQKGGTGKIVCYDADQISDLSSTSDLPQGTTQEGGVIRDPFGREIGYIISKKRGQSTVNKKDAIIFKRDPNDESKNSVKLIKSTFRVNQGRGVADMLPAIADLLDCYEMRAKELQSAKVAAAMVGTIEREEAVADFDDARLDPTNENPDTTAAGSTTLPEAQTEPANYERLEALTGGYMDYLAKGDKFTLHDIKRPNIAMGEFLDHVTDAAGSVLGLAHAYSRMKADTSYTAFRGDMVMTWVSIYVDQKDLEREWLDWVAVRAIQWAMNQNKIPRNAPQDWKERISWHLPKMPNVDALKEAQADAQGLKNGTTDFAELLGPNWKEKMDAFSEQLEYARTKKLPLSVFEQKSGGMAGTATEETDTEETATTKDDKANE